MKVRSCILFYAYRTMKSQYFLSPEEMNVFSIFVPTHGFKQSIFLHRNMQDWVNTSPNMFYPVAVNFNSL